MIRHISVFQLKNLLKADEMRKYLQEAGEKSSLVLRTETGINITRLPEDMPHPPFGDLVQVLDFSSPLECSAWPRSKEHLDLIEKTKDMELIAAIDYKLD